MWKTSIVAIIITILVEVYTLSVPQKQPSVSNELNNQSIIAENDSLQSSLLNKIHQFEQKYAATLLNATFLPFVGDCKNVTVNSKPVVNAQGNVRYLCLTYFDMVYNLMASGDEEFTTPVKVNASLSDYDDEKLVKNFCEFFGGELPIEDAKRPFVVSFMVDWKTALQTPDSCKMRCYDPNEPTLRILPVCKLISGGYRLANKHLKSSISNDTLMTDLGSAAVVVQKQSIPAENPSANSTRVHDKPSLDASITVMNLTQSTVAKGQVVISPATNSSRATPSDGSNKPTGSIAKSPEKTAAQKTPTEPKVENPTNGDGKQVAAINNNNNGAGGNDEAGDGNVFDEANNNNDGYDDMKSYGADDDGDEIVNEPILNDNKKPKFANEHPKSRLTPQKSNENVPSVHNTETDSLNSEALFEDTDSNFFSYFMFLMLITIIFYLVYHNKTKVLALVIEGRRGRSGYSRNIGRRKQHSAEYRKLDSNLEEAIQSSDQVLSTQIIY